MQIGNGETERARADERGDHEGTYTQDTIALALLGGI